MRRSGPLRRTQPLGRRKQALRRAEKPKQKKRTPTRTSRRKKAANLWSLLIRGRDRVCQADPTLADPNNRGLRECVGVLQGAHIFSRGYPATSFAEDNGVALCIGHHKFFTERPLEWEDWVVGRIGREAYQELRERAKGLTPTGQRVKWSDLDYDAIIAELSNDGRWK